MKKIVCVLVNLFIGCGGPDYAAYIPIQQPHVDFEPVRIVAVLPKLENCVWRKKADLTWVCVK